MFGTMQLIVVISCVYYIINKNMKKINAVL